MGAEVDAVCGAAHGERHPERVNRRNGNRERSWDTRAGTIERSQVASADGGLTSLWDRR